MTWQVNLDIVACEQNKKPRKMRYEGEMVFRSGYAKCTRKYRNENHLCVKTLKLDDARKDGRSCPDWNVLVYCLDKRFSLVFFCFSLLTSHVLRMKTEFQTIQLRHNIGWLPSGGGGADKSLQILTNRWSGTACRWHIPCVKCSFPHKRGFSRSFLFLLTHGSATVPVPCQRSRLVMAALTSSPKLIQNQEKFVHLI